MDDSTVSTMLRDLAETPAPPLRVDISRARAAGRRRVRIRRVVTSSAAAGLLAVVAAAGLLTSTPQERESGGSMPSVVPTRFDPLVQYAEFGWLPDGSIGSGVSVGRDHMQLWVDYPAPPTAPSSTVGVRLFLAAAGGEVDRLLALPAYPRSDEPAQVNGRAAWWAQNEEATTLRWEYAPGTWAGVEVLRSPSRLDQREIAHRVAESIRYNVNEARRLPFTTTGVPSTLSLFEAMVYQSETGWSAHAKFDNDSLADGYAALTLDTWPSNGVNYTGGRDPNTTVDGHPAWVSPVPGGGAELYVFDVDGLVVRLGISNGQTMALLPGGLEGLFRATRFYADPADWR